MSRYTKNLLWDWVGFILAAAGVGFLISLMMILVALAYRQVFL